ncbi:37035_t:CDS:2 [Gigaspora margarita]|uniref:37035_t:CDS:1 n=1 Tax=Gigaspora margarita TaxID=4874 RepID=A0ABN7UP86_GIGMA|nr:37035_t:CDS:2 [Gigaspora margarita]
MRKREILIMCIFLLYLVAQVLTDDINVLIFKELFPEYKVVDRASYDDGTILLRVTRPNSNLMDCNSQEVNLRLIHPNGTISSINLNVSIPDLNYCSTTGNAFTKKPVLNNTGTLALSTLDKTSDAIRIYAIIDQYILVTYFCKLPDSFDICGLLLTWDSRVLSNTNFGDMCTDSEFVQNINTIDGNFLRICYISDAQKIIWTKYSLPDTGTINVISNGTLNNIARFNRDISKIFPTEDGGYGIINTKYSDSASSSFNSPVVIYVIFIPAQGTDTKGPFQIYTRSINIMISIRIVSCHISYVSLGYSCLIYINQASNIIFVDVDFLSSGSIMNTYEFTFDPIIKDIWNALPLYYGGNCIMATNTTDGSITGVVYSDDGKLQGPWGLPKNYSYTYSVGVFPNNTVWAITTNSDGWSVVSSSNLTIYSTIQGSSVGFASYRNALIQKTFPVIISKISPTNVTTVTITFLNEIKMSDGNISIWEFRGSFSILRQSFSGNQSQYVQLFSNKTVVATVLSSTFNRDNSTYYVTIDNGFVKDAKVDQQLLGIKPTLWNFTTDYPLENIKDDDYASAIIRFTPEGSTFYENLSSQDQIKFSTDFSRQLASIIPCDPERISTTKKYQYDRSVSTGQILFRVYIGRPTSSSEVSSARIIQDMDTLIRNKAVTQISKESNTLNLDPSFGSFRARELSINNGFAKWWQQYSKTALVFIFISGLDSDILNFIASKVAGISALNAPFLWKTRKAVCFWNLFILIIEDISQFIILPTNLHHAKHSIRTNDEEIVIDNDDDEISGTPFPSHLNFSRKTSTSHHQKHKTVSSMSDYYRTEGYTNDNGDGGTGDRGSPTFYNNLTEENHSDRQQQNVHSLFSSVGKRGSSPETEISESVMLATNAVGEPVFSLRNPEEYRGPEVVQRSLKGKLVEDSIINIEDNLFEDMSSNEAGGSGVIRDVYGGMYEDAYGDAYGEVYEDAYGEVYGDGGRNSTSSNRLSNIGVIGNTEELLPEKENGTAFSEFELEENIAAFSDFDFGGIYPQTDINIGIESDTFNRSRDMELDSTTVRSSQIINTQIGSSEDNQEIDE